MLKHIKVICIITGLLIIIVASFAINSTLEDSDTVNTMLPPCSVDEGLPIIGNDEVTCYWGMAYETLEIPDEAIAADVMVNIEWVKDGVWIGIADASEANKCTLKTDYYECEKDTINLIAGGPNSLGQIEWNPEPGEYRFVAGGEDSQTMQQFNVDWSYSASLKSGLAIGAMILGTILLIIPLISLLKN